MVSLKRLVYQNYHWIVVVVLFVENVVFGGIINNSSAFIIPVTEGLEISRTVYSMLIMLQYLVCTISTMATSLLFRRFGYKKIFLASLVLAIMSCFICAVAQDVYMYGLGRVFLGMSYGPCFTAGAAWIINAWFRLHHGTVLGVVTMGTGVGGSILSIILIAIIQTIGWRWAFAISGFMQIGVMLLCLLVRNTPEEMGLKPYGDNIGHITEKRQERGKYIWPGISEVETRHHPAYWLAVVFTGVSCVGIMMASGVLVAHFQDNGYTPEAAAQYQSVYMIALAVAKLLCGWISEKIGGKALSVICMLCAVLGLLGLSDLSNGVVAYGTVVVFAIGLAVTSICIPLMSEAVFGVQTGVRVVGTLLSMATLAGAISSPISNFFFDAIGSYNPVFRVLAGIELGLIGLLFVIFWTFGKKEKEYLRVNSK